MSGGGDLSTNRQITLDVSSGTFTDGVTGVVDGLEVISGSAQITAGFVSSSVGDTLQQVTDAGSTTDVQVQYLKIQPIQHLKQLVQLLSVVV